MKRGAKKLTCNSFEKLETATQKQQIHGKEICRCESWANKALENDFKAKALKYNFLESLILAQDERWRRA